MTVNGKTIDSPALNVTPEHQITVDGKPLAEPEPPRIWLYHKPTGLVTTNRDEKGRETVFDHLPADLPRVMTVGRLDLNSEGLLLLTNDGEVKRKLELPATGWLRRYRVRVNGKPTDDMLVPLREGITLDRETFPADGRDHRPPARRQRLADRRPSRRQKPRNSPSDGGRRPDREPADPRQLWPVPAWPTEIRRS